MVTREDMDVIKDELDDRYVQKGVCNEIQQQANKKFANDNTRIELIMQTINFFKKLGWVLVTATVGQCVLMLFELVKG